MKFRQMQVHSIKNNMPTDVEVEAYRENHRRRMQRIEERFNNDTKPCKDEIEPFESVEKEAKEEEKVPLFTVIKRVPPIALAEHVESDLVLEDLSSGEEEVPCRREIVLVRKTQADKAAEKRLVERLASHIGEAKASEEEVIDFGEVEYLLQDGKVPLNSILETKKGETVVEWPLVDDKFRSYLSWQTEGSTPPSQVVD